MLEADAQRPWPLEHCRAVLDLQVLQGGLALGRLQPAATLGQAAQRVRRARLHQRRAQEAREGQVLQGAGGRPRSDAWRQSVAHVGGAREQARLGRRRGGQIDERGQQPGHGADAPQLGPDRVHLRRVRRNDREASGRKLRHERERRPSDGTCLCRVGLRRADLHLGTASALVAHAEEKKRSELAVGDRPLQTAWREAVLGGDAIGQTPAIECGRRVRRQGGGHAVLRVEEVCRRAEADEAGEERLAQRERRDIYYQLRTGALKRRTPTELELNTYFRAVDHKDLNAFGVRSLVEIDLDVLHPMPYLHTCARTHNPGFERRLTILAYVAWKRRYHILKQLLVAGGAANSAALLLGARGAWRAHAAAVVLPALGGLVALAAARAARLPERAARTLTIETLVKSPTLAYVLAVKHFDAGAAAVPAAAMVSLAALGAGAASLWARAVPPAGD